MNEWSFMNINLPVSCVSRDVEEIESTIQQIKLLQKEYAILWF